MSELPKPEIELARGHSGAITRWLLMIENGHSVNLLKVKITVMNVKGWRGRARSVWALPAIVRELENQIRSRGCYVFCFRLLISW